MTHPDLAARTGALLLAHRESLGISRRALAERHGLAPNTLREVELGLANPTLRRIEVLAADVYGVELAIITATGPTAAVTGRPVARAQ